jgi:hypothetical protein
MLPGLKRISRKMSPAAGASGVTPAVAAVRRRLASGSAAARSELFWIKARREVFMGGVGRDELLRTTRERNVAAPRAGFRPKPNFSMNPVADSRGRLNRWPSDHRALFATNRA